MKEYIVKVFNDQSYSDAEISFVGKALSQIRYRASNIDISAEDEYPFFALVKIRLNLEELGIKILCNGSRLDVYPSGMALTSIKAYELEIGKQATKIVNIFDPAELEKIATVAEQKKYRDQWSEVLRQNNK